MGSAIERLCGCTDIDVKDESLKESPSDWSAQAELCLSTRSRSSIGAVHQQLFDEIYKLTQLMKLSTENKEITPEAANQALIEYFTVHMPSLSKNINASISTFSSKSLDDQSMIVLDHDWGYEKNGADWSCDGQEQSPIDIVTSTVINSPAQILKIWWNENPIKTKVVDNGHTLMLNAPASRCVGVNDSRICELFEAIQLHFHEPSEHTIDGYQFPLEMHIVHTLIPDHFDEGVTRNLAVLGFFFELDDTKPPNTFIDSLNLTNIGVEIEINFQLFLGDIHIPDFFAYKGSLTTPPCSEIVNWFVLEKSLHITSQQLDLFSSRWGNNPVFAGGHGNNRALQPLNRREVFRGNCDAHICA